MNATFLVHVNVKDPSEIPGTAEDIEDSLLADGFDVESVEPWDRPSLETSGPNLTLPPTL